MNNLAGANLSSLRFRKDERIKGQQQLFIFTQLVGEDEANRYELGPVTVTCRGYMFNSMKFGFNPTTIRLCLHGYA